MSRKVKSSVFIDLQACVRNARIHACNTPIPPQRLLTGIPTPNASRSCSHVRQARHVHTHMHITRGNVADSFSLSK
mgnify:CR=1 FL=1